MDGYITGDPTKSALSVLNEVISRQGRRIRAGANKPIRLDDPGLVRVVASGHVNLFLVQTKDSHIQGTRFHMARINAGHCLFGFPPDEAAESFVLAVPGPQTDLFELPVKVFDDLLKQPQFPAILGKLFDAWVVDLSAEPAADRPIPFSDTHLQTGDETPLQDGQLVHSDAGSFWMTQIEGTTRFMGMEELPLVQPGQTVPICPGSWLVSVGSGRIRVKPFIEHLQYQSDIWTDLGDFQRLMQAVAAYRQRQIEGRQTSLFAQTMDAAGRERDAALADMRNVLVTGEEEPEEKVSGDPLFKSCRIIGDRLGITLREPPSYTLKKLEPVHAIAETSKVGIREVALKGKWWKQDLGPLLAFMAEDGRPVALVDRKPGRYQLHDPSFGTKTDLTEKLAAKLKPKAWMFIRPFPHKPLSGLDLVKFGMRGCGKDVAQTFLMAVAAGLLSLVTPLAVSMLFDQVIPSQDQNQLVKLVAVLSVAFIAVSLFQLVQVFAQVRVEGKMVWSLQCAMWDRILALPVTFFRQFSAGDLANRSMGVDRIRQVVSGTAMTTVVTAVFSGLQLGLLFYFSAELAVVAILLGLILSIVPAVCLFMQTGYQISVYQIMGRIQGFTVQILSGIAKLRVHAAEDRAFNMWAEQFALQRTGSLRSGRINNLLVAYSQSFGLVGTLVILVWIFWTNDRALETMSSGSFLAFVSAFTIVLTSAHTMLLTLYPLVSVRSLYRRTRPILQTLPEAPPGKADPGELKGGVEFNQVCFRYQRGGPLVIKNMSLAVNPRELVALVGPSGSGKTTVMRLLLGFELPESGSIQFDRQALHQLDVQAVRRQIGVVLQNSTLMAGTIFENIIGSAPLTMDDAWEAVRKVDLEQEIKRMPMGMYTIIGEGGEGLSGGERQRLLMARALVRRPRLLFLDEATSALDNQSQAWVGENLESLKITRIVIAQRLSTTRKADRICVVVDGRIVETGTFDQLMSKGKVFPLLAKRQLA